MTSNYRFQRNIASLILFLVLLSLAGGVRVYQNYLFNVNCSGYLKRAANANSVPLAKTQLEKAIKYLEKHDMTSGNTAVFFPTPASDVEFFFANISTSLHELQTLPENAPLLESSNVLMKLRETLIEHKESGEELNMPSSLAVFPYNKFWLAIWITSGVIVAVLSMLVFRDS